MLAHQVFFGSRSTMSSWAGVSDEAQAQLEVVRLIRNPNGTEMGLLKSIGILRNIGRPQSVMSSLSCNEFVMRTLNANEIICSRGRKNRHRNQTSNGWGRNLETDDIGPHVVPTRNMDTDVVLGAQTNSQRRTLCKVVCTSLQQ